MADKIRIDLSKAEGRICTLRERRVDSETRSAVEETNKLLDKAKRVLIYEK